MSGNHGSIAGRVVDADNAPLPGASVAVSESLQVYSDIAALTDADGRFRLGGLEPGLYTLTVHSPGHRPCDAEVIVVAGQQADMEIRIND